MVRTIYLDNIKSNAKAIKQKSKTKLCAVVKCNAYGHGIKQVAKSIKNIVDCFAISNLDEAKELKKIDIHNPIINIGTFVPQQLDNIIKLKIIQTIHNLDDLKYIYNYTNTNQSNINIDININSGFNRLGLNLEECKVAIKLLFNNQYIKLHGIYTHFCDYSDKKFCKMQYDYFRKCAIVFDVLQPILHCISSNGLNEYQHYNLDMVRCGIALYGFNDGLMQAMQISSKIIQINFVTKGQRVGYNNHTVNNDCVIATVQGGYGQGLLRGFYKHVIVNNNICPIIGDVCMDFFMIDVTAIVNPKILIGNKVIISNQNLSLEKIAKNAGTIPYQLLTATNIKGIKTIYIQQ
ncbi:MAG: alanine racemase [Firmicutes bacterium]|nr:alanine racemase [Bacillota bacterium]